MTFYPFSQSSSRILLRKSFGTFLLQSKGSEDDNTKAERKNHSMSTCGEGKPCHTDHFEYTSHCFSDWNSLGNPCCEEADAYKKCLEENNHQKLKCQEFVDEYKRCQQFWVKWRVQRKIQRLPPTHGTFR